MSTDFLLVLFGLWCFAAGCFLFGWIMGAAAAMGKQADEIIENHRLEEISAARKRYEWSIADRKAQRSRGA